MNTKNVLRVIGLVMVFLIVLFLLRIPMVSSLVNDMLYIHPFSWFLVLVILVSGFFATALGFENQNAGCILWATTAVTAVVWIIWLFIQGPLMYADLYRHTQYVDHALIEQSSVRRVPYTVAQTNFDNQNPYSKSAPGDLDFVDGQWISSIDCAGYFNCFSQPTQGFYTYQPDGEDKVVQTLVEFPFSEAGNLTNSATYFIRNLNYFTEFHEIIYVQLPDGEVIAVTSLIKRAGFTRYPYLWKVLIIHSDGRTELLNPADAQADARLEGIALRPEWLAKQEVIAYGYRYGPSKAIINRLGRITIQSSLVNDENSAPFLMQTPYGPMWYTPFSPLGSGSMIGMAMAPSHEPFAPIAIWSLPQDQAVFAADSLVAEIESSPGHQQAYNWYRETSESACGNVVVLELVPLVRREADGNHLYFMGYVAPAPKSTQVLFYSIIDPVSRVVFQDLQTADEVDAWLRGEFELAPQVDGQTAPEAIANPGEPCSDLSSQSDESLLEEIRRRLSK